MKFRQLCFRNQRSCKAHLNFILSKIHAQTVFDFSKKWDAISLVAVEPLLWITQVWGSYGVAVLYEGVYQGKLEGQRTETPDQLVTIPVTCAQHRQRRCTCSCQWGVWGTNSSQHYSCPVRSWICRNTSTEALQRDGTRKSFEDQHGAIPIGIRQMPLLAYQLVPDISKLI